MAVTRLTVRLTTGLVWHLGELRNYSLTEKKWTTELDDRRPGFRLGCDTSFISMASPVSSLASVSSQIRMGGTQLLHGLPLLCPQQTLLPAHSTLPGAPMPAHGPAQTASPIIFIESEFV